MKPTAVIHHDKRYHAKDGTYPVKIKITFKIVGHPTRWVRKFYGEGFHCTEREFATIGNNPRSEHIKEMNPLIGKLLSKAVKIINENDNLTVALFESLFFGVALDTLDGAFGKIIDTLKADDRIGTRKTYTTALNSLKRFAVFPVTDREKIGSTEVRFSDIDRDWLVRYERWMLKEGKRGKTKSGPASVNSVGIHLRTLRAVFNWAISKGLAPAQLYPFKGYRIRTEAKYKIPLNNTEIQALKSHDPKDSAQAIALDMWLFSYYCNGMNMVDVAKLRHSDIHDDFLVYDRTKTRATKTQFKKIVIPLDPEMVEIIKRRGAPTLDPNGYVFPILIEDLSAVTIKNRVQTWIKEINAGLKKIGNDLGFKKKFTTVIARHTYSNRMLAAGAPMRMVQEGLGHGLLKTTENYAGTMNLDEVRKVRQAALYPEQSIA